MQFIFNCDFRLLLSRSISQVNMQHIMLEMYHKKGKDLRISSGALLYFGIENKETLWPSPKIYITKIQNFSGMNAEISSLACMESLGVLCIQNIGCKVIKTWLETFEWIKSVIRIMECAVKTYAKKFTNESMYESLKNVIRFEKDFYIKWHRQRWSQILQ